MIVETCPANQYARAQFDLIASRCLADANVKRHLEAGYPAIDMRQAFERQFLAEAYPAGRC